MNGAFGPHIMLDLKKCNRKILMDTKMIYNLLNELPTEMGMTKVAPPYVFPYSGKIKEDDGVTGVVIIAESHLTIHTFVNKNYAFIDMFSCRDFDTDKAVRRLRRAFKPGEEDIRIVNRGLDFPRAQIK